MKDKEKLTENWEAEMWRSLDEQDVMQLRGKLNDIHIQTEKELQSFNMNCTENF